MRGFGILALGLLVFPLGAANAGPTRAERAPAATRDSSSVRGIVDDSRAVVLGSALVDRFQTSRESSEAAARREVRALAPSRASAGRDHRRAGRDAAPAELELAAGRPGFGADFTGTVNPIPEPTSNFLFLAGVGLIALVARRKFTGTRRIRS